MRSLGWVVGTIMLVFGALVAGLVFASQSGGESLAPREWIAYGVGMAVIGAVLLVGAWISSRQKP